MKIIIPTTNELMKQMLVKTENEIEKERIKLRKEENEHKKFTNEEIE